MCKRYVASKRNAAHIGQSEPVEIIPLEHLDVDAFHHAVNSLGRRLAFRRKWSDVNE